MIARLRAARSAAALEALLTAAAAAWGMSDYAYLGYTRRSDLPVRIGIGTNHPGDRHPAADARRHDRRPPLERLGTLIDYCRHRLAPLIWQSDDDMRRISIAAAPQKDADGGWCGVAVPIHGPRGDFGVFLVTSRCRTFIQTGTRDLALIHSTAIAVHETAMRNCGSTRFGLQYETVDAPAGATCREQEQNIGVVPTVH